MRLALISDIHGNEQAFRAVLEDISKAAATHSAVLGDLSYRGPKPKECLQLVRDMNTKVIKGNADEWLVRGVRQGEVPDKALALMQSEQAWSQTQLSQDDLDYLKSLPYTLEIPVSNQSQLYACHATPDSLFDIIPNEAKNEELDIFTKSNQRADFYVYGHIHLPYLRSFSGKKIINTGSVGLPFDGDPRASYVIIERSETDFHVQFRRVTYDIEKACYDLDQSGYPEEARNLIKGIYRNAEKPS